MCYHLPVMAVHDVYLSFAPPDARLGAAILQFLTAARLSVTGAPPINPDDAAPAVPWLARVARRINQSRKLVIIITDQTPVGWLKAELDSALRQLEHEVIPVVRGATVTLPPQLVPLRLESDPSALQRTLAQLAQRARAQRGAPPAPRADLRPFPGLRPFGLHDGRWFFGRDRDITEATRRLGRGGVNWLRIEGAAGIGKTSFARAGVSGAVLRGGCAGPMDWLVVAFRPGLDPMRALVTALVDAFGERFERAAVESALFKPDGLITVLSDHLPAHVGVLMIVDHLDDLATAQSLDQPGVHQFDGLIGRALAHDTLPLLLITTGNTTQSRRTLDVLPKLTEAVSASVVYTLGGLSQADLERSINGPLRLAGLHWPKPLITRLIDDSTHLSGSPGPLAWLLARLHRGPTPSVGTYEALGGLRYGPGRALDARLDALEDVRRDRTLTLLLALISAGRGRDDTPTALSPADAQAIAGGGPDGLALIKGLAHGTAAAPEPLIHIDPTDDHVRLLHSELLRIWPRLRGLAATYRIALERRADVERRASSWDHGGRNPGQLPDARSLPVDSGADLPDAQRERLRAILSARARAYIGAAEATLHALEVTQEAVTVEAQRRVEARLVESHEAAATQRDRVKLVFFSAAGGIVLLLVLLFLARRDAAEAQRALQRARDTHAQTAETLAERTANAKQLTENQNALNVQRDDLSKSITRSRKTALRASQEAEALLRFGEASMKEADARLQRLGGTAGGSARRAHAEWAATSLRKQVAAAPKTDRLRLLTARLQLHLAEVTATTGPLKAVGGRFKNAQAILQPLAQRPRPAPAVLTTLAEIHAAASRFYLKRRGVALYRDPALARAAAQAAADTWRRLVKLYPQQPRNAIGLARALLRLGEVQLDDGLDATVTLREAVRAHQAQAKAAPQDFDIGFALARCFTRWGEALAAVKRPAEARAALAQATAQFTAIEGLAPAGKQPQWQSARERARRLLSRLSR